MFLDTSGLLCYLHRDEPQHADAAALFESSGRKLIHNYIIAEFVALAAARRLPRMESVSFAADLLEHPDIDVIWVAGPLHREGMRLLTRQLDKSYSLCDTISFLAMNERGVVDALTTDQHFERAGFKRLLKS